MTKIMTEIKHLDPKHLNFIQSRAEMDYTIVDEYATLMADGVEFDPAQAIQDESGQIYVWDGYHRGEAAKKAQKQLPIVIKQGTKIDADWLSLTANQKHGLRRSQKDKQRIVEHALKHPHGVSLSNRQIARHCGVSDKTVAKIRQQLEASAEIPQIVTRTVTRNGTSYAQKTTNIGKAPPMLKLDELYLCTGCNQPTPLKWFHLDDKTFHLCATCSTQKSMSQIEALAASLQKDHNQPLIASTKAKQPKEAPTLEDTKTVADVWAEWEERFYYWCEWQVENSSTACIPLGKSTWSSYFYQDNPKNHKYFFVDVWKNYIKPKIDEMKQDYLSDTEAESGMEIEQKENQTKKASTFSCPRCANKTIFNHRGESPNFMYLCHTCKATWPSIGEMQNERYSRTKPAKLKNDICTLIDQLNKQQLTIVQKWLVDLKQVLAIEEITP